MKSYQKYSVSQISKEISRERGREKEGERERKERKGHHLILETSKKKW